jgi:sorbitol-specific phosphotransferase system component IIC
MKTPEEYLEELQSDDSLYMTTLEMIEEAQKDAYNQALEDASNNATAKMPTINCAFCFWFEGVEVYKQSILKLKK